MIRNQGKGRNKPRPKSPDHRRWRRRGGGGGSSVGALEESGGPIWQCHPLPLILALLVLVAAIFANYGPPGHGPSSSSSIASDSGAGPEAAKVAVVESSGAPYVPESRNLGGALIPYKEPEPIEEDLEGFTTKAKDLDDANHKADVAPASGKNKLFLRASRSLSEIPSPSKPPTAGQPTSKMYNATFTNFGVGSPVTEKTNAWNLDRINQCKLPLNGFKTTHSNQNLSVLLWELQM